MPDDGALTDAPAPGGGGDDHLGRLVLVLAQEGQDVGDRLGRKAR